MTVLPHRDDDTLGNYCQGSVNYHHHNRSKKFKITILSAPVARIDWTDIIPGDLSRRSEALLMVFTEFESFFTGLNDNASCWWYSGFIDGVCSGTIHSKCASHLIHWSQGIRRCNTIRLMALMLTGRLWPQKIQVSSALRSHKQISSARDHEQRQHTPTPRQF